MAIRSTEILDSRSDISLIKADGIFRKMIDTNHITDTD